MNICNFFSSAINSSFTTLIFLFMSAFIWATPSLNWPNSPDGVSEFIPNTYQPLLIIFAAHPDDETIGISGYISQAKRRGYQVVVEMMTDGNISNATNILASKGYNLNPTQFGQARLREFYAAMNVLSVDGISWNKATTMKLSPTDVQLRINFWKNQYIQNMEFYSVAGSDHDFAKHQDHQAVYEAVRDYGVANSNFFLVYQHRNPSRNLYPGLKLLDSLDCINSRKAKKEYAIFNPEKGRYAIGWTHSTPDLFRNSYNDCTEYVFSRSDIDNEKYNASEVISNTNRISKNPNKDMPTKENKDDIFLKIFKLFI